MRKILAIPCERASSTSFSHPPLRQNSIQVEQSMLLAPPSTNMRTLAYVSGSAPPSMKRLVSSATFSTNSSQATQAASTLGPQADLNDG